MNTDTKEDLRRGFISNSADLAVSADLVLSVSADLAVSATRVTAGLDTRPVTVCGAALASQLRDEQLVHQSGARPDRIVEKSG